MNFFVINILLFIVVIHKSIAQGVYCSEEFKKLGYKCCINCLEVAYHDETGYWGREGDSWCGCSYEKPKSRCSKDFKELGYDCCREDCKVVYTDETGDWGYENDEWCGCKEIKPKDESEEPIDVCKSHPEHKGDSIVVENKSNELKGTFNDIAYGFDTYGVYNKNQLTIYEDASFTFNSTTSIQNNKFTVVPSKQYDTYNSHIIADLMINMTQVRALDKEFEFGLYGIGENTVEDNIGFPGNITSTVFRIVHEYNYPFNTIGEFRGRYMVDGVQFNFYETGIPSITVGTKHYIGVRSKSFNCGTIDISEHFRIWREAFKKNVPAKLKIGTYMKTGYNGHSTGIFDVPLAKVYEEDSD